MLTFYTFIGISLLNVFTIYCIPSLYASLLYVSLVYASYIFKKETHFQTKVLLKKSNKETNQNHFVDKIVF